MMNEKKAYMSPGDLTMPNRLKIETKGTTGIRSKNLVGYTEAEIRNVLRHVDYRHKDPNYSGGNPSHVDKRWDCEDRAIAGVVEVRCQLPGCPVGLAVGWDHLDDAPRPHAVVIFWFKDNTGNYTYRYFEPNEPNNKQVSFKSRSIIPFPAYRPTSSSDPQKLPPLDKCDLVKKGAFSFDEIYDFSRFDEIEDYLEKRGYGSYPEPADDDLKDFVYFEDRASWVFSKTRRRFIDAPIGVAFGSKDNNPYVTLVLWKSDNDPRIWDLINRKEIGEGDFKARVVIV